jgi:hypothetical protein
VDAHGIRPREDSHCTSRRSSRISTLYGIARQAAEKGLSGGSHQDGQSQRRSEATHIGEKCEVVFEALAKTDPRIDSQSFIRDASRARGRH